MGVMPPLVLNTAQALGVLKVWVATGPNGFAIVVPFPSRARDLGGKTSAGDLWPSSGPAEVNSGHALLVVLTAGKA
jgi:hypothetical protein